MLDARQIQPHIANFTDIYEGGNKIKNDMPDGVKLTVYYDDMPDDFGFIVDATSVELGLWGLVAKKWILHSELLKLINEA